MINLNLVHTDLQQVANKWKSELHHFLYDTHTKKIKGKVNKYTLFDNYVKKFNKCCKKYKLNKNEKDTLATMVNGYKSDISKSISDVTYINTILQYQETLTHTNKLYTVILKEVITAIYNDFTQKKAYSFLTSNLDIKTCPYCNRTYTFTIGKDGGKGWKTRPEFDHFYDKSKYPLLALSFYNLIPSCPICNHAKSTKPAKVNPYFSGFNSKFVITGKDGANMNAGQIAALKSTDDFSIDFENPTLDEKCNIETFGLNALYNGHKDYALEIIEKSLAYKNLMNTSIVDTFQGVYHSPQEVHQFVWGKHLDLAQQENRPLSKFTKDILEQLGITI